MDHWIIWMCLMLILNGTYGNLTSDDPSFTGLSTLKSETGNTFDLNLTGKDNTDSTLDEIHPLQDHNTEDDKNATQTSFDEDPRNLKNLTTERVGSTITSSATFPTNDFTAYSRKLTTNDGHSSDISKEITKLNFDLHEKDEVEPHFEMSPHETFTSHEMIGRYSDEKYSDSKESIISLPSSIDPTKLAAGYYNVEKHEGDSDTDTRSSKFAEKSNPSRITEQDTDIYISNHTPKNLNSFTERRSHTPGMESKSDINLSSSELESKYSIEVSRNPKKIVEMENKQLEARLRPARPDPGYTELDLVRPYRPDTPLHQYPYYRPTPDYRTPVIRQDSEFTRPEKPDPDHHMLSFRPSYTYSRPSYRNRTFASSESSTPRPYRPSYNRPSYSQISFGKPYRPDYPKSQSASWSDNASSPKSSLMAASDLSYESELSRADYDFTRQYDVVEDKKSSEELEKDDTLVTPLPNIVDDSVSSNEENDTSQINVISATATIEKEDDNETQEAYTPGLITPFGNLTKVEYVKADCFDNYMKMTIQFNGTFDGLIYSAGYAQDHTCNYVNGSGKNNYEFVIRLNRCGTLGQQDVSEPTEQAGRVRAQYLVNTVTIQYNPVIEEVIDEHFRITCEYAYDFWKTVSFPMLNVESGATLSRIGNPVVFTLAPPSCHMEIRQGYGPTGQRIAGPVNVGDPITLVIQMKSEAAGFDIQISNCQAHNGADKRLQLIDEDGCVAQEKLIDPFKGVANTANSVTLYTYLKAFRFTGSRALYLECDVHMCHGTCPPQKCDWKPPRLSKRSLDGKHEKDGVISESISLFQALEVRQHDDHAPSLHLSENGSRKDDKLCFQTKSFAGMTVGFLFLMLISILIAMCLYCKMKRFKTIIDKTSLTTDNQYPL